jgi:aspartyl-tRNA(Asn)/glutamyl-tRNA(Gln) amidotransferase subunit C
LSKLLLKEVEAIANLARLALTDEEKAELQDQLSAILDYVEALQELDTDDIPPTASALPLDNIMRPDITEPSLPVEKALANAPDQAEGQFKVKPIL